MGKYIRKALCPFIFSIIFSGFVALSTSALPLITKNLINRATLGLNAGTVLRYGLQYIGAVALILLSEYGNKLMNIKYRENVMLNLKKDLLSKILGYSYADFHKHDTDHYLSLFTEEANLLFSDYFDVVLDLTKTSIYIVVYSAIMLFLNPLMAAVIIALSLLGLFIPKLSGGKLSRKRAEQAEANKEYIAKLKDITLGIDVAQGSARKILSDMFISAARKKEKAVSGYAKFNSFVQIFGGLSLYLVNIGAFITGMVLVHLSRLDLGGFVALLGFVELAALPFRDLVYEMIAIKSSKKIKEKFLSVFAYRPSEKTELADIREGITLNNVSYKIGDFRLQSINLEFRKGRKYAIVGESGSGKSLLVKLLLGFLKPDDGAVLYDEIDIDGLDVSKLVAYISQDIFLYNATGMDNVTLFDFKRSKNLDDNIDKLKARELLERNLGELGMNISGGEKNKIAILRGLNLDSKVMVLDESLANLDEKNKKEITDFLIGLDGVTVILITHDYEEDYLNRFDEVIRLKKGRVEEVRISKKER